LGPIHKSSTKDGSSSESISNLELKRGLLVKTDMYTRNNGKGDQWQLTKQMAQARCQLRLLLATVAVGNEA
jgi:hypothetical protein